MNEPHAHIDGLAVLAAFALVILGLLNLQALGEHELARHQAEVILVGVALYLVLRRFHTGSLRWLGWTAYIVGVLLLLAVPVMGVSAYGAQRWLSLGGFTLQPSEFAKVGLILVLAQVLGSPRPWYRRLLLALVVAAVPISLVVLEPDLSTATVLTGLTIAMLVLGRIPIRLLILAGVAVAVVAPFGERLLLPYQEARLQAFLGGTDPAEGPGWAILQAHIALASGGLTGIAGRPHHQLMATYLPARETDLAFVSLVEQYGILAGAIAVLAAVVLIWRLTHLARHAPTGSAALTAAGLGTLVGIEVVISVTANLGLLPTAGVPFPLLSYGGTAAAVHIAALGLIVGMRVESVQHRLWLPPRWLRRRPRLARLASALICLELIAMVGVAWSVQETQGPQLRAAGLSQMTRCVQIPAPRGMIADRHGAPLAVDVPSKQVWVIPGLFPDHSIRSLSRLTDRSVPVLHRLLHDNRDAMTVTVATMPDAAAQRVRDAGLRGVLVVQAPGRHYVHGPLLSTVLGWTGVATPDEVKRWPSLAADAIVGRAGIEAMYDPLLRGTDGRQCYYVDPTGNAVAAGRYTAPVPGSTLRLTLDLGLQQRLHSALADALRGSAGEPPGDLGGAVVMDPANGQVLALASLPSYDNNLFGPPIDNAALHRVSAAPGSPMLNHVTQVAAPPGSVFKLVVASADMRRQVLAPNEVISTGGAWTYAGHTFHNWMTFGPQNLIQALAWSNDVYFYKLAHALGPKPITTTASSMGVGRETGIDLPSETPGYLGTPESVEADGGTWYSGSTIILGIGQGYLTVTPLQTGLWTAGVSTGVLATPHLGLGYTAPGKSDTALPWPTATRLPYAEKLGPVRQGMIAAATSGTASILRALPVPSGAKTGSAQDPAARNGNTDSWFTAAAPLAKGKTPQVVATSFVRGGGEGVTTSGPVVLSALQYFFAHRAEVLAH